MVWKYFHTYIWTCISLCFTHLYSSYILHKSKSQCQFYSNKLINTIWFETNFKWGCSPALVSFHSPSDYSPFHVNSSFVSQLDTFVCNKYFLINKNGTWNHANLKIYNVKYSLILRNRLFYVHLTLANSNLTTYFQSWKWGCFKRL